MMNRALRTLIAVHRHGSFRAAAERENLTPSAVSHQMKNLEHDWKVALFDRSHKTPTLTQAGQALVVEAEEIVAAYDSLPRKVTAGDGLSGELVLGAVPTTLSALVPKGLAQLKQRHPGIRVRIVPGLSNQLLLQLARGQIHGAIISRPEVLPEPLRFSALVAEELVLLVAETVDDMDPKQLLRSKPFIRFSRDAVVGRQIEAWLQKNQIKTLDAMELDGLEAIASMVAAELGVSIIPKNRFPVHAHMPLKTIQLEDNGPKRVLGMVQSHASPRAKMCEAVEHALKAAIA